MLESMLSANRYLSLAFLCFALTAAPINGAGNDDGHSFGIGSNANHFFGGQL
jgi:hypothetical protein